MNADNTNHSDRTVPIPFVDLALQHAQVEHEVRAGFDRVLSQTAYVLGPDVQAFEQEFAAYCGTSHCVGVGNGTDALELAFRAAGVMPGDEVILPANTFVATAEAVARTGAKVVIVDCDDDFLIDTAQVKAAVTARTRAVVPVHLYGQMAPVSELRAILPDDVMLIEDAAQAQGARRDGHRAGSLGAYAATSFYPGKNLGAYGDAGAVLTDSDEGATRLHMLRNHGGVAKYEHLLIGVNSRLDTLQAVVLRAKLRLLDTWNDQRRAAADRYASLFASSGGVVVPRVVPGNEHVWHLYVVRVPDRDRVLMDLASAGIRAGVHYPAAVHRLPAFAHLDLPQGSFPVAERAAGEILSLPMFPGITQEQQERVVTAVSSALGDP